MSKLSIEATFSRLRHLERDGHSSIRKDIEIRDLTVSLYGMQATKWFIDRDLARQLVETGMVQVRAGAEIDPSVIFATWGSLRRRECADTPQWFCVGEALAYKLLATDLKGALYGDLKMPFDAFLVELPAGILALKSQTGKWLSVKAMEVTKGYVNEEVSKIYGDPSPYPVGEHLVLTFYPETPDECTYSHFQVFNLQEDTSPISTPSGWSSNGPTNIELEVVGRKVENEEAYMLVMRFLLNLCLYLSNPASSVVHQHAAAIEAIPLDAKPKKLRERTRLLNDSIFLVGTNVTIDNEVKECVRLGEEAYYKLTYRTMVRGHYRNQACGPKLSLRSVKWIEPHIRGKDLPTPVVGHNYTVK